jgi:RNA polymerase sigma-70 factor (ECF subfamily)
MRALQMHAYRMLGSLDDADEALQDALLSAWRALDGYESQAPLSHWRYRITPPAPETMSRSSGALQALRVASG